MDNKVKGYYVPGEEFHSIQRDIIATRKVIVQNEAAIEVFHGMQAEVLMRDFDFRALTGMGDVVYCKSYGDYVKIARSVPESYKLRYTEVKHHQMKRYIEKYWTITHGEYNDFKG